jgi:hypothetical protein
MSEESKGTAQKSERNEKEQVEEEQDEVLEEAEKKKKARIRTRGPYRKAHVDWE